ncbi:hypothetical protein [Candidatus Hodgkinia cicadicola]|uniref:hypothetical protein n=1 Tax=Candidatus Hodgkinia cicadicola TaxID=573658 RepID=UPI001788CF51
MFVSLLFIPRYYDQEPLSHPFDDVHRLGINLSSVGNWHVVNDYFVCWQHGCVWL